MDELLSIVRATEYLVATRDLAYSRGHLLVSYLCEMGLMEVSDLMRKMDWSALLASQPGIE